MGIVEEEGDLLDSAEQDIHSIIEGVDETRISLFVEFMPRPTDRGKAIEGLCDHIGEVTKGVKGGVIIVRFEGGGVGR